MAACIVGASIIYVDLIVQRFPRCRNFRIQDSNAFLSASLSLSFGVMVLCCQQSKTTINRADLLQLFSALYSMLPSSKNYLVKSGLSPSAAAYALIGCFLGGVFATQFFSRLLHFSLPSHVVDCDHSHELRAGTERDRRPSYGLNRDFLNPEDDEDGNRGRSDGPCSEESPLLSQGPPKLRGKSYDTSLPFGTGTAPPSRKPSVQDRLTRSMTSLIPGAKSYCDQYGPCYGYSEVCGHDCFKVRSRSPSRAATISSTIGVPRHSSLRSPSYPQSRLSSNAMERLGEENEESRSHSEQRARSRSLTHIHRNGGPLSPRSNRAMSSPKDYDLENGRLPERSRSPSKSRRTADHHHHVPSNAFLSIGLQTSIAIALHKLPEGFITYATNHANPRLGFAVFMALFIHNITEGFAMALPLYLATNSRMKSLFWSSLLGGISQPLGASIAVFWLRTAKSRDAIPSEGVYGAMFAITSGIMTSVALQLFSESLALSHNKTTCIAFAFIGMGSLGLSFAMTA